MPQFKLKFHSNTVVLLMVLMALMALVSVVCALSMGAANISLSDVTSVFSAKLFATNSDVEHYIARIITELRLPRTLLAFLAGSGLAISGLILQTVTRNPLADPYLFGISSGASFGVVIFMSFTGINYGLGLSLAAFIGSIAAMLMLLIIANARKSAQVESMLLAGVALSFLFSAGTSLLLYWSDPDAVTAILFWTLGSFSRAHWDNLLLPSTIILTCIIYMLAYRRHLAAMLLGDESATTLGIHVQKFRLVMLVLSSLLTATLVSLCGGIGFVGLIIPHIVRFFVSQGTSQSVFITALAGGIFMVWVDIFARTILSNQELPVGVITAAVGSIFFLSLLYFRKHKPV